MNTKRLILICIISLLAILTISTLASADTYEVYLDEDDILEDGNSIWPGTVRDNTSLTMSCTENAPRQNIYTMWNISSIPPQATITNVSLNMYVTASGGAGYFKAVNMSNNTLTSSNLSLYQDTLYGDTFGAFLRYTGDQVVNTSSADWTPLAGGNNLSYNVENDLGWWAVSLYQNTGVGPSSYRQVATTEHAVYPPMCLWVEFEMTAPYFNESNMTLPDGSTDVCLNNTTCMWFQHDHGVPMNIYWHWWNSSDSSWNIFSSNTSVTNGTYCANNIGNWTEPCTTYYWYVNATDISGNETQSSTFEFTTHCPTPPSSISCTVNNTTSVNISWTPDTEACGSTNTTIYYQHGAYAPAYGAGTFGGNFSTATNYTIIEGLTEGQCYSFGLWSAWNSSLGTWHLSNVNTKTCCAAGGEYRITFYDEDTLPHIPIDFTEYPWNQSTHKLITHYWDATEDEVLINLSNFNDPAYNGGNCSGIYWMNVSATQDVAYFELRIFYDWNATENIPVGNWTIPANQSYIYPEYSRKLNTYAVRNYSLCGFSMKTVDFYITDRTTYLQSYQIKNDTATTEYTQNTMNGALVSYNYYIYDSTGSFTTAPPQDAFITFYERNISGQKIIIHQEYIDVVDTVNPYLIFEKDYLVGANCTDCTNVSNSGIAPTSMLTQNNLYIISQYDEDALFGDMLVNYSFDVGHTHLYFTYTDPTGNTDNTTLFLYQNFSNTTAETITSSPSQTYTYPFNTLPNISYYIVLVVNRTVVTAQGNEFIFTRTFDYYALPGISPIANATNIELLIVAVIGEPPGDGATWITIITVFISLVIFLGALIASGPTLAFIASGLSLSGIGTLLTGSITPLSTVGILFFVIGFVVLISHTKSRGLYK